MKKVSTPLFVIVLSVSLSAGTALLLSPSPARGGERTEEPHGRVLDRLDERLSKLEAALARWTRAPLASPRSVPAERVASGPAPDSYAELLDRLEELEGELARVRERAVAQEPTPEEVAFAELERRRKREVAIAEAKLTVVDPAASDEDKLEAHASLRRVPDAYTPNMIADLVQLGLTALDPEHRADVWRNFDGSSHLPELVPHLRDALANDGDPRARDEAAETLGNYLDDPHALAALKWSAEHDPSPRVRQKALRTLNQWSLLLAEERGR